MANHTGHERRAVARRSPAQVAVTGGILLGSFLAAALAVAAPGDLDPDFGEAGRRLIELSGPPAVDAETNGMAVQQDGKIVLAIRYDVGGRDGGPEFAVMRLNSDGSTETAFGDGGVAHSTLTVPYPEARAVAIQKDGRIVAAGHGCFGSSVVFLVARFTAEGTLDTTFNGTGFTTADFAPAGVDRADAIAIQRDAKIVAAGTTESEFTNDFALARFNPDGSPDDTFQGPGGTPGRVTTDFGREDYGLAMALQKDGRIVVAGETSGGGAPADFALARYGRSGSLDPSFDGDGKVITDFGLTEYLYAMAVQKDGKILATGSVEDPTTARIGVARYKKNGRLDPSFDGDGRVLHDLGDAATPLVFAAAIAPQKDGRIVLAGARTVAGERDFMVARLQKNGFLDPSFNGIGFLSEDFGGTDGVRAVALKEGRILVAGSTYGSPRQVALARYLGR